MDFGFKSVNSVVFAKPLQGFTTEFTEKRHKKELFKQVSFSFYTDFHHTLERKIPPAIVSVIAVVSPAI